MTRTNQVLSVLLIAQIILAIFLLAPDNTGSIQAAGPLLAGFEPESAVKITVEDGTGSSVVVQKSEQDEWVLPDKDNYPVQMSRVQDLLNGLKGINRNRLIARNPANHSRLRVASNDYERLITVELADGSKQTVYLGSASGASAAHVRLDGEDTVYLTNALASWQVPARLTSWINTTYFTVPRDRIVALQIENANGVFQLQKADDGWQLVGLAEGETFDPQSVERLLTSVSTIRMTEPLGKEPDPEWNMDQPAARIRITVQETVTAATEEADDSEAALPPVDSLLVGTATPEATESAETDAAAATPTVKTVEKTYEIKIGQVLAGSNYPLISSESEFYVRVSAATAQTFVDLKREDFLVTPEEQATETPAETATPEATATTQASDENQGQ